MKRPFTPEETEMLRQLHALRLPARAIGERLGRSKCTINGKLWALGLTSRHEPPTPADMERRRELCRAHNRSYRERKRMEEFRPPQRDLPSLETRFVRPQDRRAGR